MQIERTEGLDPLGLPDNAGHLAKNSRTGSATDQPEGSSGFISEAALQPYVERAAEADAIRSEAVQQAKRLLASGELDTPETARRAAENILRLGI